MTRHRWHRQHPRQRALLAALTAGLLAATMGAGAAVAETPAPNPTVSSPTQDPAKPPIALMPVGSSFTGPLIGVRADDGARIIAQKWLDPRTVDVTITSPAVGANVVTRVVVPRGWSQTSSSTWPLAMLLHGGVDDYTSWDRETSIKQLSSGWGVIVAMPDAGRQASYTNFYNSGRYGTPQWETFHTVELIQILERGFRANGQRAVGGLSSGGYGAMAYATRKPGLWKFTASYSGAIAIRIPGIREAIIAEDASYGGDPFARFGLPIINESNWAARDPYTNAAKLRGMGVFLSSGYTGIPAADDVVEWSPVQLVELVSGNVTVLMDQKLTFLGIKHTTDLYAFGEHAWVSWNRELARSWPLMMQAIGARKI